MGHGRAFQLMVSIVSTYGVCCFTLRCHNFNLWCRPLLYTMHHKVTFCSEPPTASKRRVRSCTYAVWSPKRFIGICKICVPITVVVRSHTPESRASPRAGCRLCCSLHPAHASYLLYCTLSVTLVELCAPVVTSVAVTTTV